jgi:hypothetical protein
MKPDFGVIVGMEDIIECQKCSEECQTTKQIQFKNSKGVSILCVVVKKVEPRVCKVMHMKF